MKSQSKSPRKVKKAIKDYLKNKTHTTWHNLVVVSSN